MKAFIKGISYYLPETVLTNEALIAEFPEWTVEKVASKIGVAERRIAQSHESTSDMATKAAEKLIAEYQIDRSTIDFVLLCTQSPDYFLPTTACIVQSKLRLNTSTGALDFNLGCSGYVYGLSLAKGLILGGIAKNVLLITAETYSKFIHEKDKGNRTIFGDAAAATLVSTDGFAEIENFSLGSDGRGADNLIVRNGASINPDKTGEVTFDAQGNPLSDDHLYMNGAEIFNFTLEAVPLLVEDTLRRNNLDKSDISLFVFHQANRYMMNFLRKKIKIEEEKFYYFLEKVGNTVSSTIPIALKEAMNEGRVQPNSKLLLAGFGVGYSWGGCVVRVR